MKLTRHIIVTALVTMATFMGVLYTSCSKDACKNTVCLNGSSCEGGNCRCRPGSFGSSCEMAYAKMYGNTYAGNTPNNPGHGNFNNTLTFYLTDTSDFTKMRVEWRDTGSFIRSFDINLSNQSSAGSTFTLEPAVYDSKTYTGNGTLTPTMASMNLKETDTSGTIVYYSFNNFVKQ